MERILKPFERFEELCQRYGDVPVCRSYSYLPRDAENRGQLSKHGLSQAHRTPKNSDRLIEFVYSSSGIKRDGNAVDQRGWRFETFRDNPTVLWCHDREGEPLGRSISEWTAGSKESMVLRGIIEFMPPGINAQADRVYQYYREGFLHALSISWKPLKYERMEREDYESSKYALTAEVMGGLNFTDNEPLEITCCPVPADPDSLIKRIASGEIRAEDFTLPIQHEYVHKDGRKTGIFYVDAHEYVSDSRIIVDMAVTETTPQAEEAPAVEPAQERTPVDYSNQINTIRELVDDGYRVLHVELVDFDAADLEQWTVAFGEAEVGINTIRFSDGELQDEKIFIPFVDGGSVTVSRVQSVEPMVSGVVPFQRTEAATGSEFRPSEARVRVQQWATNEDGLDTAKFRSAFAWADVEKGLKVTSYRLIHHDVENGQLVVSRTGLDLAAQWLMQGRVEIPFTDLEQVREHLSQEYAVLGVKAPWQRPIGRFYEEIHTNLRRTDLPDADRLRFQSSAVNMGEDLFPNGQEEPWQSETDETKRTVLAALDRVARYFTNDAELIDDLVSGEMRTLVFPITPAVMEPREEPVDPKLTEAAERLAAKIGLKSEVEVQPTDEIISRFSRVLRMVEESNPLGAVPGGDNGAQP